jgi:hypothetical protein
MRMPISGIYKINGTAMSLRMPISGIYKINGTAMPISGIYKINGSAMSVRMRRCACPSPVFTRSMGGVQVGFSDPLELAADGDVDAFERRRAAEL